MFFASPTPCRWCGSPHSIAAEVYTEGRFESLGHCCANCIPQAGEAARLLVQTSRVRYAIERALQNGALPVRYG